MYILYLYNPKRAFSLAGDVDIQCQNVYIFFKEKKNNDWCAKEKYQGYKNG